MKKHIDLLGLLYLVWGAVGIVLGIALLALAFGAAAIAAAGAEEAAAIAAGVTAATLAVIGGLLLAWGLANGWAGSALRRIRPLARPAVLALAVLNLFVLPFGTALAIYSFWVLLSDEARQTLEPR